jgi:hypothetical protein
VQLYRDCQWKKLQTPAVTSSYAAYSGWAQHIASSVNFMPFLTGSMFNLLLPTQAGKVNKTAANRRVTRKASKNIH